MKKYPTYKDSGVEWIGEIPTRWKLSKLKFLVSKIGSGVTPKGGSEVYVETGIPLLRSQNIYNDGLRLDEVAFIAPEVHASMKGSQVKKHDVLLNITGASLGRCFYNDGTLEEANVNQHVCIIRANENAHFSFLHKIIISELGQLQISHHQTGSGREGLNFENLNNFVFPTPPIEEQTAIAHYLDQKTALIDTLLGQSEKIIALLQEQRTAIINQAVTKGLTHLPPAQGGTLGVPLKDSGVEWIGEVPEHWYILELKRIIDPERQITYGIVQPGEEDKSGRYMVRGQDYSKGWVKGEKIFKVSSKIEEPYKRARLKKGDIVFTIVGAGVGNVEVVPYWLDGANITQTTARISLDENKCNSRFIYYYLQSSLKETQLEIYVKGAAQPGLNLGHLKLFLLPLPNLKEQTAISNYLDQKTTEIVTLIQKEEQRMALLKEYRASLISEVVTGKVMVADM